MCTHVFSTLLLVIISSWKFYLPCLLSSWNILMTISETCTTWTNLIKGKLLTVNWEWAHCFIHFRLETLELMLLLWHIPRTGTFVHHALRTLCIGHVTFDLFRFKLTNGLFILLFAGGGPLSVTSCMETWFKNKLLALFYTFRMILLLRSEPPSINHSL